MKIERLRLQNFGIYAGRQIIDFSSACEEKPIILLGGYNGRGKTTILEAILLGLYGKRSYVLTETKMPYNKYLSNYINRNDTTFETSIEVVMSVEIDSVEAELSILRKWCEINGRIKEECFVCINGRMDEVLTDDWANQVEFLLPVGMARFFLFDGEKVSELVDDFSEEKLKQAIKTLLGIDVIEQLGDDLKAIIGKNKVAKEIETNDDEVMKFQGQKEALQAELEHAEQTMATLRSEIKQKTERLDTCDQQFSTSGGALFGKQETTMQKRASIEKKLRVVQSELHEKLAGAAPLCLVKPLLENARRAAKIERDYEILSHEINGVEQLIQGLTISSAMQERFDGVKEKRQQFLSKLGGTFLSLSPAAVDILHRLCSSQPEVVMKELELLLAQKNELQQQLQSSEDYLSIEVNQKKLQKLAGEMRQLNRDVVKAHMQLEQLELETADKAQLLASVQFALDRLTAQRLTQYESNDNSVRLAKYAMMAKSVLGQYRLRIQEMKIDRLSKEVTKKFRAIIGKKNLIQRIVFQPKDLTMELLDEYGKPFDRKQLSAGEQQLLSTAIVWGIVECTGMEFPMIIDTPLARLDSAHREQFIDNYIPNAGKQVIIFSTDAEITNELEERIDRFVARKYLLQYDENTKSTTVKEGYFA